MSWHFSAAQVEEFSAQSCLDIESCALLRSIRTAERSSFDGKRRRSSRHSPSGTTCEPSTADRGVASWISSLRASRANLLARQLEDETMPPTCSAKWNGLSLRFSLGTFSSRTYWHAPIRQDAGLRCNGFAPPSWVPRIHEHDSGWLPTPTATANAQCPSMLKWPSHKRLEILTRGKVAPVAFWEWMMDWPLGWTDLRPLETAKYREWLSKHGGA